MTNYRTITIPAGIGDWLWIASKLLHTGEKFNIILPDGQPQRGHQILELMPDLVASHRYAPDLNYEKLKKHNIQEKKKEWRWITEKVFALSANTHVEAGKRIEAFLPDLPPTFRMEFATSESDKKKAAQLLPEGKKYVGIYGSAYRNARHHHYNGWGPAEWLKLIKWLHKKRDDFSFVIIGAPYDADLADMIMAELKLCRMPYVNTVGQPLSVVVEILKRQFYFLGFPSGLSILNEYLGKNGLMFYGHRIQGIINTWADPERIKSGEIKECLFAEPEKIYDWLVNTYKLLDR